MTDVATRRDAYLIVSNSEGRRALWAARHPVPTGWHTEHGPSSRDDCLAMVREAGSQSAAADVRRGQPAARPRAVQLGLMFFGDQEYALGDDKYRLVLECAKFADRQGLDAIWLPERHFTKFGCLFPSPAVLHAALARETCRVRLRAGSIVMPLHHAVRVAEEWSVVDNLSGGRVDLSFASGWHADDFALWPDRYPSRKEEMFRGIKLVQKLWRGERIRLINGAGDPVDVRVYPTPVQKDVSIWLTAATSRETFQRAGEMGANVLTHLFDQRIDELAKRIDIYREARRQHGWNPDEGKVTVTLHTFIGPTLDDVRREAQAPYCQYLKSNFSLLKGLAVSRGVDVDVSQLDDSQLDQLLAYLFDKFLGDRSLLGTPQTCAKLIGQLAEVGVNEVACLLDFGIPTDKILDHLPQLAALNRQLAAK